MGMDKETARRELKCNTWSDLVLDIAIRQQAVVPTGVCSIVFPDSTTNCSLNFVLLFIIVYLLDVHIL
jgi:hypothetical protein